MPLIKEKIFAGVDALYLTKRKTGADNYAKGLFVSNFTLFRGKLISGFEISASVYNLFNEKYGDPGSEEHVQDIIQQDGRSFRIKLSYRIRHGK